MTSKDGPLGHDTAHDKVLLAALDDLLERVDPIPPGLVERVQFAIALENLDVDVARWQRGDMLAGVRAVDLGTVTFTLDNLTVMVTFVRSGQGYRIDGWLVPEGRHTIEVRIAGQGSHTTVADQDGRFVFAEVPKGTTQIMVRLANDNGLVGRTVVTPTIVP